MKLKLRGPRIGKYNRGFEWMGPTAVAYFYLSLNFKDDMYAFTIWKRKHPTVEHFKILRSSYGTIAKLPHYYAK